MNGPTKLGVCLCGADIIVMAGKDKVLKECEKFALSYEHPMLCNKGHWVNITIASILNYLTQPKMKGWRRRQ